VLPDPFRATAPQPLIVAPLLLKATLPVGPLPVTEAVNVTVIPCLVGLLELANVVGVGDVVDAFTTCDRTPLVELLFVKSPA